MNVFYRVLVGTCSMMYTFDRRFLSNSLCCCAMFAINLFVDMLFVLYDMLFVL